MVALVAPTSGPHDPRLLARAAEPGRIRGIGLELWAAARGDPAHAGAIWSRGLRQARALHSRERRLVGDLLVALVRSGPLLEAVLGTPDPEVHWLGWLVHLGLPTDALALQPARDLEARAEALVASLEPSAALALVGALPPWVARALLAGWGDEAWALLAASNERAPVTLRANRARTDRTALARALAAAGVATEPCVDTPDGLRVVGRANLMGLAAWRAGAFEVQDAGSQRVGALVPTGGTVLDLCAGAGGKALQLAAAGAEVVGADVRTSALAELRRRARRAGARIRTIALPAELPTCDAVLVDAPCTGSGTLRRAPAQRWQWTRARCDELLALQAKLLRQGAGHVCPGGTLVYATCSVLPAENTAQVTAFLEGHPAFALTDELSLAPHTTDTDGFYAARMIRR